MFSKNWIYYRTRLSFWDHDFYTLTLCRLQAVHIPWHFHYFLFSSQSPGFLPGAPLQKFIHVLGFCHWWSPGVRWSSDSHFLLRKGKLGLLSSEQLLEVLLSSEWINPGISSSEHVEEKGFCGLVAWSPGIYWNNKSNLYVCITNAEMFALTVYLEVLPHTVILGFSKVFVNISNVL